MTSALTYSLITEHPAPDDIHKWLDRVIDTHTLQLENPSHFSVVTCNDAHIQTLNKTYRDKDKPTNILSFPDGAMDEGKIHLGDLIISTETMTKEADDMGITTGDHWCHILVHGILHLLGHDHEKQEEATEMENLEVEWLARMGIKNPYEDTEIMTG